MPEPSEDTLHHFLHTMPAVLYEYVLYEDGRGEFLYVSPTAREILGHPAQLFVERMDNFWERIHPDDLARLQEEDRAANRAGNAFVSRVRFQLPSGDWRAIRIRSKPTSRLWDGAAIWSGFIVDETDLVEAEAEIRALRGTLPTCMHCRKIRPQNQGPDDPGSWVQMETYIREHSEAEFSHTICPECERDLYDDEDAG